MIDCPIRENQDVDVVSVKLSEKPPDDPASDGELSVSDMLTPVAHRRIAA
jgi:hypothetical protein